MESLDFPRLVIMIRRATNLLALPDSAMKLIQAIDGGEASARDLERIIAADPGLASTLLRVSAHDGVSFLNPPTLRQVIMRLGQRSVRSVAVSLAMKELLKDPCGSKYFEPFRFARHGLVVGFLARFVYARRQMLEPFESDWSADELFSAGVLHDLGTGLLAYSAPEVFDRVYLFAKRSKTTFDEAFKEIFGSYPSVLGAEACDQWRLPPFFGTTMRSLNTPWDLEEEYTAQCCLSYAHSLAEHLGEGLGRWEVESEGAAEAVAEVGLAETEVESLKNILVQQVESYMAPSAGSRAA